MYIVVSVVSQFMHALHETQMLVVHKILKYLKSTLGKGSLFSKHGHLEVEG